MSYVQQEGFYNHNQPFAPGIYYGNGNTWKEERGFIVYFGTYAMYDCRMLGFRENTDLALFASLCFLLLCGVKART